MNGTQNARGVVRRTFGEMGDQERELAAKSRGWAQQIAYEFPRAGGWYTRPFGLVLLGNPALTEHWTERARGQFDQLIGRIGPLVDLKGATPEDVAAIALHHGVTDAGAMDVLQGAAAKPGGLHNVAQVLSIARVFREKEGAALSADVLRRAALVSGVAK